MKPCTSSQALGDAQPFSTSAWHYTDNPLCICGDTQSMSHIVNDCPVNKFEGGRAALHTVSDSPREWLRRVNCIQ